MQINGNGLHRDTPWWGTLLYRMFVVATLAVTAFHQFRAHSSCASVPLPPGG